MNRICVHLDGNAATFEAYYDTDPNITWLTNAYVNGFMTWWDANTWAANFSFPNGTNIYDNWRLPTMVDTGTRAVISPGRRQVVDSVRGEESTYSALP